MSPFLFDVGKWSGKVYDFIWDLINEGEHAHFLNQSGRFAINWKEAVDRYFELSRPDSYGMKSTFNRVNAGNKLRSALLNYHGKYGAKEYLEARRLNDKNEVIERHFQMPQRILDALKSRENVMKKDNGSGNVHFEVMFIKMIHADVVIVLLIFLFF